MSAPLRLVYFHTLVTVYLTLKMWNDGDDVTVLQEAGDADYLQCAPGRLPSLAPQNRPSHHEGKQHVCSRGLL